jgi:hypothetical protein
MNDWLHNLPVVWMALVVFGFTYLVAAAIYAVVTVLAVDEQARSFKAISPGMLPPLGIIFGLFVAFTAERIPTGFGPRQGQSGDPGNVEGHGRARLAIRNSQPST